MKSRSVESAHDSILLPGPKSMALGIAVSALAAAGVAHVASSETDASHSADTHNTSKSYTELAADSAQNSYDPSKDTLVIDGIRIKPNNSFRDSPSQAVLNHPEVVEFMSQNPDEAASLEASSLSLGSLENDFAVVERDIDSDGDTDAVAVPVK